MVSWKDITDRRRIMVMTKTPKSLTVRLAPTVYEESIKVARRRRLSLNALIQESLRRAIAEERALEMFDAATILGSDPEESDVEFALAAQAEVVFSDESS